MFGSAEIGRFWQDVGLTLIKMRFAGFGPQIDANSETERQSSLIIDVNYDIVNRPRIGVASAPRVSSRSRYAPTMVDHRTQNLGRGFSISLRNPARRAGRACSGTIKCFSQVLARPPRAMMSVKPETNMSMACGLGTLGSSQPNGPFRGTRSIRSAATAAAAVLSSDVR
jgi:hypothetical protein